jgi:hypothetical protein
MFQSGTGVRKSCACHVGYGAGTPVFRFTIPDQTLEYKPLERRDPSYKA